MAASEKSPPPPLTVAGALEIRKTFPAATRVFYPFLRRLLFALDAETAHDATLRALGIAHRLGLDGLAGAAPSDPSLATEVMGLRFPNPVGLAAGLDKNGVCVDAFGALGFGFVEVGTVTPRPQPGNPKPRLFRLPEHEAIINRMGFNNVGIAQLVENVRHRTFPGILGINLGKNFDTPNERAIDDYLAGLRAAAAHADYLAVNLSSPNTAGLRDLQETEACRRLAARLVAERDAIAGTIGRRVPIAIKIAPDVADEHARDLARVFRETRIDGVIATNTTLARDQVAGDARSGERGGLSGAPLRQRSTEVIRILADTLGGDVPIIGVGGIGTAGDALEKLDAGASLVQVYTGLIYHGPSLIHEILEALVARRRNTTPPRHS